MSDIYALAGLLAVMFAVAFGVVGIIIYSNNPRRTGAIKAVGLVVWGTCGFFAFSAPVFVALSLIESAQVIR